MKKIKTKVVWISGIAFVSILTAGMIILNMNTETDEVDMQSSRELLVENKQQEIEVEGQKENINTQLEANEDLNYVIYIDEERYRMIEGEKVDRIVMKEKLEEDFPEVYMEIYREDNATTEEVVATIKGDITSDDSLGIRREERVTEPLEAEMIQGMGLDEAGESFGAEWNTPIHEYYVTDTRENQVFVIKQVYFLEAAEGHGARFHHMLETFEIIE